MSDAKRDNNRVPAILAVSNVDGETPVVLWASPSTHRLLADWALMPATSGGLTTYRNIDLDETGILVSTGAHQVYGWYLFNGALTTRYIKFYNKATAPTVGTDTPVMTIPIPAGSAANVEYNVGIASFPLGLGIGATTAVADNSTAAPSANDCIVNIFYY